MALDVSHDIPRRDIRFSLRDKASPDWFNGNPYLSAYCDGLSIFFPSGERFFIRSVAHYLPQLEAYPQLREEIRGFMAQEALHTREHEAYNDLLRSFGYPVDHMDQRVRGELAMVKDPLHQLAFTAAIEHLTATLGHLVLHDDGVFAGASEPYRDLWTWHCLEEVEHKGVAFDVFRIVTEGMPGWKRYLLRCSVLLIVTLDIHRILLANMRDILSVRGKFSWRGLLGMVLPYCVFWPGYYRRSLPYFLSFFRPYFDPWKAGNDAAVAKPWQVFFDKRAKAGKDA